MKKHFFLLLIAIGFLSGCEKDDICDATTITTPRVVIEFYDVNIPTNLKIASNLRVVGFDENGNKFPDSLALGVFSDNKILLPLRANSDSTKYSLTLNSTVVASANEDILQFDYSRQNVYVSRACGYKTLFELQGSPDVTDQTIPENTWIKNIIVTTSNINDESETHIKIYF